MEEEKKISEDEYAGTDFSDDDSELRNSEFIDAEPAKIEVKDSGNEKISKFFDENNNMIAAKLIEKKSGTIVEIKYGTMGRKSSVVVRDKNKRIRKNTEYYENEAPRLMTDYGTDGSYKSVMFNVDGSRQSFVVRHKDGTSEAVYYDADGKGSNLVVKMDAAKNVIEKRIDRA